MNWRDGVNPHEYDRWRTRDPHEREPDPEGDAYRALDEWHSRRVVTDFSLAHYKPGQKVKFLDGEDKQCDGVVVGATVIDAIGVPTYVVLHKDKVIEVDEIVLMHEWEPPGEQPPMKSTSPAPGEDDIPF